MPVRALSGGERARLLLAKLFAEPSNLVVLDEPTNDLDMDTLDLLQEVLSEYDGTVLIVSHDRDFLDRLTTSVIAVEGEGRVSEYPGGYSDYLVQRPAPQKAEAKIAPRASADTRAARAEPKLSGKEQKELTDLPGKIAALEKDIATIEGALHDPISTPATSINSRRRASSSPRRSARWKTPSIAGWSSRRNRPCFSSRDRLVRTHAASRPSPQPSPSGRGSSPSRRLVCYSVPSPVGRGPRRRRPTCVGG